MDNSTLLAFKDAQAAGDYLNRDELLLDDDEPVVIDPLETTARSTGVLRARRYFDPNEVWATCPQSAGVIRGRVFTLTYSGVVNAEQLVWTRDDARVLIGFAETAGDRIVRELGRIKDGWAGPGTVAPSATMLADVEAVVAHLLANAKMPSIEVDEEDGSVALRWVAASRNQSFSLVFRGNGKVSGVLATIDPPRSKSWSLTVNDEIQIASRLDEQAARQLITD
ncbi:hypothetical protein [Bradyrhizobium elkanii]|uniref:hypothetical protein n=1 Tax=Bradyrhizobium elkanii TaxID=29448 RepID=UPI0020A15867|nr:hypothetical protein [Bradyrhizobium elkanii]MCP1931788.1 hypothetical protein [Bradyrhizobium elkanii]